MSPCPAPVRALAAAASCTALVVVSTVLGAGPAGAAPAPPQLSIVVDNGRTAVAPGDRLTYALTVTNLGPQPVRHLRITSTVPRGATFVSADRDGHTVRGAVRWTVDVPATRRATVRATLRVADATPPDLLRLATVACATTAPKGPPLVCATDSDLLPGGAAPAQAPVPPDAATPATSSPWPWTVAAGLVVAGTALALLRRLRRRASEVVPADQPLARVG